MGSRLNRSIGIDKDIKKNIREVGLSIEEGLKTIDDIGSAEFIVKDINIKKLVPSKNNFFKVNDIEDLAEDIKENGLSHNLLVRPLKGDKFEIISGERRYEAFKLLGRKTAPCKVVEELKGNDIDTEIVMINTNAKTRQLSDLETAEAIKRLENLYKEKKKLGLNIKGRIRDNIAADIGISGRNVERLNRLNKLIPGLKKALSEDKISTNAVEQFASMDEDAQKIMLKLIKNGEKVDTEKAKVLKEEIELSRLKLIDEIEELKNLKTNAEISPKKTKEDILKTSSKKATGIKQDPKEIEDNATITIAINMLSGKLENKDLKISDKNLKELKKLDDKLAKII